MPISLERISELLELDVSELSRWDSDLLLHLSEKLVARKGEQYLSENKGLLKAQFDYLKTL